MSPDAPSLRWTWRGPDSRASLALGDVVGAGARLDPRAVAFFWNLTDADAGAACFEGVRRERAPLGERRGSRDGIGDALARAVAQCVRGRRAAIALSGGLDSAAVLACAVALGVRDAYVLAPVDMPGYDERDAALATGRAVGARVTVVEARAEDFVAALPAAIAAAGVPLYNLHPVGKYILARRAAADGFDALVTGDGADEAASHGAGERWLPIAAALADAGGAPLACPFTHGTVRATFPTPDPDKRALRAWLTPQLPELASRPKHPRYAPAMDVSRWLVDLEPLAEELATPLCLDTDADRVRWASLALLVRHVRG